MKNLTNFKNQVSTDAIISKEVLGNVKGGLRYITKNINKYRARIAQLRRARKAFRTSVDKKKGHYCIEW